LITRTLAVVALTATTACAETILSAEYADPTDRYAHGILGDAIEWGTLEVTTEAGTRRFPLSQDRVFEDVAPRLVDLDNDGTPEVIVVETLASQGAQLAVYDASGKIAATPHIGRTNRWLAPMGAADRDGDGTIEIAYIDRPHLAKTLRVWRYEDGELIPVADLDGLTNHRIGETDIGGGIRDCGNGPEMITASSDWSRVMSTTLADGQLSTRSIGAHVNRGSFAAALACTDLP
jgi:hypothetical protein